MRTIGRLIEHMAWADAEVVRRLTNEYAGNARIARIAAHVLAAEHVWLRRIRGDTPELAVWPDPEDVDMEEVGAANARGLRALSAATDDELSSVVRYANSRGEEFETELLDILLHVALHGSYHRAQIALLARDAGAAPVNTDYITFVRKLPASEARGRADGPSQIAEH
jgi:uncharacterized damage-inducible protein DinB